MDISDINPRLRAATKKAPRINFENALTRWIIAKAAGLAPGKRMEGVERRIVVHEGVRLRVYIPAHASGAALLWVHGGGLVVGSAALDDIMCSETAAQTGAVVVSVGYRLAPAHRFPAAIDDCYTGWRWLQQNLSALGIDPNRVAIGGQSAGGGLAANLVHRAHDAGDPIAAQWLFCPMLDDRTAADRSLDAVDHFVWNNRSNLVGWSSYLGSAMGGDELPPYAAASRRGDLSGLPTTWIYTSDIELFRDEDLEYARRLTDAGVDVTLEIVNGAPHGFEAWAPKEAMSKELLNGARDWLDAQLSR
ncbi:alpha/beta hydrolase [Microbacterium hydrocarbonoxydans]|jgi:acetyl esterase/lipase|uniref:alpha/beta hydrolase n=1 Tax=Microbacterium hydrocarbonoxydans TaxID=273678 RepID=UPI003D99213C